MSFLPPSGRRLAGAERLLRVSQEILNHRRDRVRAAEHTSRDPCRVLERRHCLAEIVERGSIVVVERSRVIQSHLERESIINTKNAPRHSRVRRETSARIDLLHVK